MFQVVVCDSYEDLSARAAVIFAKQIREKPDSVLGLATGSTPEGMYADLIRRNAAGEIDFSRIRTVNLDEYYPIAPDNDQSYRYFMNQKLFNHVNIDKKNTYVPDGTAKDPEAFCASYEQLIASLGGIDLQVLGIGQNGHIAFNEPDEALVPVTHLTSLTANTIAANARFFDNEKDVPRHALTMGMGTILSARRIVLLANGANKADAIATLLAGKITTACPASLLCLHRDVTIICDRAALSKTTYGV